MKTPVEILKIRDPDGVERIRLTLAFQDAIQNPSLNKQIIYLQEKYLDTIKKCEDLIINIRESKKSAGDPILKWRISNVIYNFLMEAEANGFVITNFPRSLSRDLGLSISHIDYFIEFKKTYPSIEMVNKKINWDKYKEILDVPNPHIRQLLIEKILNREIQTRNQIRNFKKMHLRGKVSK
jgi:hypothetical protein